jgi:beta-lactamase regulating signal transducer with metallopeptidase domain
VPLALPILHPPPAESAAEWLLRTGLSNALAATVLALVVAALCRIGPVRRRPAVVHGLWLLVLLKLLAPPVWSVSLQAPERGVSMAVGAAPAAVARPDVASVEVEQVPLVETESFSAEPTHVVEVAPREPMTPAPPPVPAVTRLDRLKRLAEQCRRAAPATALVWAAGTFACLGLAGVRILRFRRVLRHADAAPRDVQARTAALAREMGVSERICPAVWFVPGAVSPMLWALPYWLGGPRGPRLLLPLALWDQLDARQRDAILLHELAHLRRRDHWVRLLELAVTAMWWWHPVAWWARRRLREAEEQCCDAWVVWARPASVRHYATALLEALDFAAASFFPGGKNAQCRKVPVLPAVPALASGMAEFHELKRRLVMIKQGNSTAPLRKLSWAGLSGVCGMAALLLPVVPTVGLAQENPDKKDNATPSAQVAETTSEEGASAREAAEAADVAEKIKVQTADGNATAAADVVVVEKTADGTVVRKIQAEPGDKKLRVGEKIQNYKLEGADNVSAQLAQARMEVEHLRAQLKKAEYQLAMLQAHAGVNDFQVDRKNWANGKGAVGWTDKLPTVTTKAPAKVKQSASDDEREARLQKLEENLSMLLKEVKSLRDEKSGEGRASEKMAEKMAEKMKSKPKPKEDHDDTTSPKR